MQVTDSLVGLLDKHFEWLQYNENSGLGEPQMNQFPSINRPLRQSSIEPKSMILLKKPSEIDKSVLTCTKLKIAFMKLTRQWLYFWNWQICVCAIIRKCSNS